MALSEASFDLGGPSMGKRKKWSATEKLRIVLAGMQPNVEVSELCRREGINPTQYYGWKKQLLSSATKVFDAAPTKGNAAEEKKDVELRRMKDVIAEITAENLELKKGFSG
jgi:transposase